MDIEPDGDILAETENYFIWRSEGDDGSFVYHVELGGVSLHLTAEEWDELVTLLKSVS
jgi:hypothetical protein